MKPDRTNSRYGFSSSTIAVLLVSAVLSLHALGKAQSSVTPKHVLVLYWYNKDYPGNVAFDQTFQATLKALGLDKIEYYPEYLESNRFPGDEQSAVLREYLQRKYAGRTVDVVVAVSDASLEFLLKYRSDLFPQSPIVYVAIKRLTPEQLSAGPGMTGIVPANTHRETAELALKLHPDTEQVFVVSGTPEHDKRFENIARDQFRTYENTLKFSYLTDLPLEELIGQTKSLPKHSLIFYLWQQTQNEHGELLETYDTLAAFAPFASAPIYGMSTGNLGKGIVGGYLVGSDANGSKMAEIVVEVLKGKRAQDIPLENAPAFLMFDWRELQRWRIPEESLPPGSIVMFREFTFWQQYKWRIIGVAALFALQTLLIAVLLIERAGRRRAKKALDRLNAELEQRIQARTAALDAKSRELETFAYSVAHDLKAPLRGIDGYSRLLIEDYGKDLDAEGRNFLLNVQSSATEMSQLIDDLLSYSRLERRELKRDRLELGPIVTSVVEEKKREVSPQVIDFVIDINGGTVLADSDGLVQALRNYMDNAVKFTRNVERPRIEIGSTETQDKCVLWVRDNGIGFDMKYQSRIFEIFQRLNVSEEYPGTGVGLAIVRKAMERMKGRAWAQSTPGEGATFYLEIPKSKGEQHSQPDSDS